MEIQGGQRCLTVFNAYINTKSFFFQCTANTPILCSCRNKDILIILNDISVKCQYSVTKIDLCALYIGTSPLLQSYKRTKITGTVRTYILKTTPPATIKHDWPVDSKLLVCGGKNSLGLSIKYSTFEEDNYMFTIYSCRYGNDKERWRNLLTILNTQ